MQESTGFSPNDLVFGHKVRTPLSVLGSELGGTESPESLADHVQGFRRKLFLAWKMASKNLGRAQKRMKTLCDRKAVVRVFSPGDQVLALLPIRGSPFEAKYLGPYTVNRQVSDTNYVVSTPERRRKTQLCHVNLLKPYFSSSLQGKEAVLKPVGFAVGLATPEISQVTNGDGVCGPNDAVLHARLDNSVMLAGLDSLLGHLDVEQRGQLKSLIFEFSSLFSDAPTCTSMMNTI